MTISKKHTYQELKQQIQELKQTEKSLMEIADRYRAALEDIPVLICNFLPSGEIAFVNKAYCKYFRKTSGELVGSNFLALIPEADQKIVMDNISALTVASPIQSHEHAVIAPNGDIRWQRWTNRALFDSHGKVVSYQAIGEDITERIHSERALRESEETLKAILAASPVGIGLAYNRILGWTNQAMYRIWGYEEGSLLGQSTAILYPDADEFERIGREFYAQIERKGIGQIETRWVTMDNREIHCYLQGCPLDRSDFSKGIIVTAMDITERKRAEEEIRSLKEKYEDLYNNAPAMHLSLDAKGVVIECNHTILKKLGYTKGEFVGKHMTAFVTAESAAKMKRGFPALKETGQLLGADRQLVTKSGEIIDVILSVTMEYDEHGKPIKTRAMFEDISERKRAEDRVHNLSQMLMQAQERERKMISYELHDCIAQNLSSLKIDSDTFFDNQPVIPGDLKEKMEKHSKLIEQTIQAVRDLSYGLRPPGLNEMGIVQTIYQYCDDFSEKTGLSVDFTPAGMNGFNPDPNIEINLYRLVQEGLNNIRKHAEASHVTIKLIAAHPNIILRIEDDGKGFDVQARENALDGEKRMGLRSMRERVNLLQGNLAIQSAPLQGCKVLMHFPYHRGK